MKHIFLKGNQTDSPTLLLLHGTGRTEQDLLPIAEQINPNANVLSVRVNILENGMPRFFKRLAEGVFDEEDLIFRTKELNEFLDEAAEKYEFDPNNILAIGYSNGANIAASLHHPIVPRRGIDLPNLAGKSIFIAAGTNDPICPSKESKELKSLLENANANVQLHWEDKGHQLTMDEVIAAKKWYLSNYE